MSNTLWKQTSLYRNMPDTLRLVRNLAYAGQSNKVTATIDTHSPQTKKTICKNEVHAGHMLQRLKDFKVLF